MIIARSRTHRNGAEISITRTSPATGRQRRATLHAYRTISRRHSGIILETYTYMRTRAPQHTSDTHAKPATNTKTTRSSPTHKAQDRILSTRKVETPRHRPRATLAATPVNGALTHTAHHRTPSRTTTTHSGKTLPLAHKPRPLMPLPQKMGTPTRGVIPTLCANGSFHAEPQTLHVSRTSPPQYHRSSARKQNDPHHPKPE